MLRGFFIKTKELNPTPSVSQEKSVVITCVFRNTPLLVHLWLRCQEAETNKDFNISEEPNKQDLVSALTLFYPFF